jgi:hypothetical protein
MLSADRPYQAAYNQSDWAFARGCYLAWDPRTGKSRGEVGAIVRRQNEMAVKRTLIVGPQKPLLLAWADELAAAGLTHVQLASGELVDRAATIRALRKRDDPLVVTINFDVIDDHFEPIPHNIAIVGEEYQFGAFIFRGVPYETLEAAKIAREMSSAKRISDLLLAWGPEAIVIDEAHLISSASATRSRALRRLARGAKCVRLLSGTPDPQRAPSYYAQYVVLDPRIFGTSKNAFLERYFKINPFVHSRVEGMKPENETEFWAKVFSVMHRVKAEDYFGPQIPNEVTRDLPWPERAGKLYADLARDSVIAEDDLAVDGTHRLTKMLRASQLCAGFLEDEVSGEVRWIHDAKTEAILADLSEPLAMGQRVVISYTFTQAGERLLAAVRRAYGKASCEIVNGNTPENRALELLRLFDVRATDETPVRVLIVQEQAGGTGISLARARHLFFHSWSMDSATHDQMRARIKDPALTSNYTYYQMRDSHDGYARAIVRDKLDASVMAARKDALYAAMRGTPLTERGPLHHG